MQLFVSVQTQEAYSCSICCIKRKELFHSLQQTSTVSNPVVRNAICMSASIWIMGKHVITSPRCLGIHPALVFKLIPQMPSAWHFCVEAGTPSSSHCWNSSHGAEQAQSWFLFFLFPPLAHACFFLTIPVSAHPPPPPPRCPSLCLQKDQQPQMINHCRETLVH